MGKRAGKESRITGARLVEDALGPRPAHRLPRADPPSRAGVPQGGEVGIDAGVSLPLALSDGNHFDHGRPARLPDGTADRAQHDLHDGRRRMAGRKPGAAECGVGGSHGSSVSRSGFFLNKPSCSPSSASASIEARFGSAGHFGKVVFASTSVGILVYVVTICRTSSGCSSA